MRNKMRHYSARNLLKFARILSEEGWTTAIQRTKGYFEYNRLGVPSAKARLEIEDLTVKDDSEPFDLPIPDGEPMVSVIIPVYNQWSHTYGCIRSLKKACLKYTFEVILADDGSTDQTVNAEAVIGNIRVVRDGVNRKFLLNCNNAAQFAKGRYLFFLNNDTRCLDEAIDRLVDELLDNPDVGIVGSKLLFPDGRLQECGGIIWEDGSAWNFGRFDNPDLPEFSYRKEVDYVSGAALMIGAGLWREMKGFDGRFAPAYYEDTDICMRVRRSGKKIVCMPNSRVIHYEGVSNGNVVTSGQKKYQLENAIKFKKIWNCELSACHFPNGENVFLSRDRSTFKPSVLIIDHYVPQWDCDAGSLCTYHYILRLISLGYNVKFMGENFYRNEPYSSELERLGVEVLVGPKMMSEWRDWLSRSMCFIDAILINRPHIADKFLPDIRKINPDTPIIFFGHDLHYLRETRRYALLPPGKERDLVEKSSRKWLELESRIHASVELSLTISNDEVIPMRVDLGAKAVAVFPGYCFGHMGSEFRSHAGRDGMLFVGGFKHLPNQDAVAWFIAEIFPRIKEKVSSAVFHIVGTDFPADLIDGNRKDIVVHGKVTDERLAQLYRSVQLVVAPLRYGAGLKGKVVQAMAHGVPLATTAIAVEGMAREVKDALGGREGSADFADRCIELLSDANVSEGLSRQEIGFVEKYYSAQAHKSAFVDIFRAAITKYRWIFGHYADNWLSQRALLAVPVGTKTVTITVWCPDFYSVPKEQGDSIYVSIFAIGRILKRTTLTIGAIQDIVIDLENREYPERLLLYFSHGIAPCSRSASSDRRCLSVVLKRVSTCSY